MEALLKKPVKIVLLSGALLALTVLFWLSLVLQKFFESETLTNFFRQINNISPMLSVIIMLIFPLTALTINALAVVKFKLEFTGEHLHLELNLHKNFLQWVIIVYSCSSIGLVLAYLFFESLTAVHINF